MDLLLILTYAALCIAIFKIFKIPLNTGLQFKDKYEPGN